jgi:2-polyprenyl-6-methoxyphenol hydroxylase-like FAD-dependent oxidoreductase
MTPMSQPVEIVGGGLAGLSLGLALRRAGVPVTVFEAGEYPRQRVCGEFITGLRPETVATLELGPILAGARAHRRVAWLRNGRTFCTQELPETALALSRYEFDARLAHAFVDAGGQLRTHERVEPTARPGRVNTAGRRRVQAPWLGLKQHVRGLELVCGLEMHLGHEAYVGLCGLPDGAVNVCGLFRRRPLKIDPSEGALPAYLRASGLAAVAARIAQARPENDSAVAVAGFGFDRPSPSWPDLRLGDARCMLPPFLGNGMAAAFQMAEEALAPMIAWSRRQVEWPAARAAIERRLQRRFQRRQRWGNLVHGFLLAPQRQRWFTALAGAHVLPLNALYRALH